ncbi:MAG: ActS/PrrB/RegB family redox-sensitive histidine kinase [Alphaproteobacteria bacterium]|nr:ActS/PrrB/RegB family redox-sensitive histidine kinase [Alphaproteobacteria bacterium]
MADQTTAHLSIPTVVSNTVLENVRWIALAGQLAAILIVYFGFEFPLPIVPCLLVVAASALVGFGQSIYTRKNAKLSRDAVLALLVFDTVQLAVLIYLTGGLANPFVIMLIAPVTVSATVLPQRDTVMLVVLVVAVASVLTVAHNPLPWGDAQFVVPPLYMGGLWASLVLTTVFVATYAGIVSRQSRNLARGLTEARLTMAREHQMVALGSLATAAAHKLGSPLNTITLIAHDLDQLSKDKSSGDLREDISALLEETERCRKILAELNEDAIKLGQENDDPLPVKALVSGLVDERFEDLRGMIEVMGASIDGADEPLVIRRPELLHPLETVIENAAQFTSTKVQVALEWSATSLVITIYDPAPGFQSTVLPRIGHPYNSSRQGKDGHMGLGVFIALTMVDQMGGQLSLQNRKHGGARVVISYPREKIEMAGPPAYA